MSGRSASILGSAIFFVLAPCTVAGLVPYLISGWRFGAPLPGLAAVRWAGALLVALGVAAVVSVIVGQAVLFGSMPLLGYAVIVWLCFYVFVLAYEEPILSRRYGQAYDRYRATVPRWLPRIPRNGRGLIRCGPGPAPRARRAFPASSLRPTPPRVRSTTQGEFS